MRNPERESYPRRERTDLRAMLRVFERFQTMSLDFPVSYARCFYQVALTPGLSVTELAERIGISRQAASRMLLEIGPKARRGDEPGWGLIEQEIHPTDLRSKAYYLSPHGRKFLGQIFADLDLVREQIDG